MPIENAVYVSCSQCGVISQQVVDGLLYLCKTSGCILKLKQFLDAKELTAFEDSFILVVYNWIKRSMPTHFTTVIIHPIWGENRLKTA